MNKKRIVITGIGVVSPIGIGKDAFWQALKEGRSGVKPITLFDTSDFKVKVAGEITEFDAKSILGKKGLVDLDRSTQRSCFQRENLRSKTPNWRLKRLQDDRTGISVGTTFGSLQSLSDFLNSPIIG